MDSSSSSGQGEDGKAAVAAILQSLVSMQNQSTQVFHTMAKAAIDVLDSGDPDVATAFARVNHPLADDYSSTVIFGGLPVEIALLIRCMIAAEVTFSPCLELHQYVAAEQFGEAAPAAATQTIRAPCSR